MYFILACLSDSARADQALQTVKYIRGVIKYFKQSNFVKGLIKEVRIRDNMGQGLESIGKTCAHFTTLAWAIISLLRCLSAIRELFISEKIESQYVYHRDTTISLSKEEQLPSSSWISFNVYRLAKELRGQLSVWRQRQQIQPMSICTGL